MKCQIVYLTSQKNELCFQNFDLLPINCSSVLNLASIAPFKSCFRIYLFDIYLIDEQNILG
jgi:hypothetical protein